MLAPEASHRGKGEIEQADMYRRAVNILTTWKKSPHFAQYADIRMSAGHAVRRLMPLHTPRLLRLAQLSLDSTQSLDEFVAAHLADLGSMSRLPNPGASVPATAAPRPGGGSSGS